MLTLDSQNNKEKTPKNSIIPRVSLSKKIMYRLMLLLMATAPSLLYAEDIVSVLQGEEIGGEEKGCDALENMSVSYEEVFRHGIKKTLENIDNLSQIPKGGQLIHYYRNTGPNKGKEMPLDTIKAWNLPEKFDIGPKNIDSDVSVPFIYFILGERKFTISPNVGKIKNIYMTNDNLVLETTFITKEYDKEYKLIELVRKLLKTPVGPGEKKGFSGVTVTEM